MKKHGDLTRIRNGGILHWSTLCLLATGTVGLTSCDKEKTYTATAQDVQMAELEKNLDEIDRRRAQLTQGYVDHNLEIPGVGFYHADAHDFFPYAYGHEKDGKWFANGEWVDTQPKAPSMSVSRPSEAALKKVEGILAKEQEQELAGGGGGGSTSSHSPSTHHTTHHYGGSGVGSMLLMYWMLSGNRNNFTPGAGFQQAQMRQQGWQQSLDNDRNTVKAHAAANPGYQRLAQQSKQSGSPVTAGKSVRGGFGGTSSGSSSSFGS